MIEITLLGLTFCLIIYAIIRYKIVLKRKEKELETLKKKYPKKAEEFWTHMAIQSFLDKNINDK